MNDEFRLPGGGFLLQDTDAEDVFTPEGLSAEAKLMGRTADDFLKKEVLPNVEQIEAHDIELMHRLMRRAGDLGLLGAEIPEVYGGLGVDSRTGALLAEKLNWQQSFAISHEAHTVIATLPLLYFGTHDQKSRYLPQLASGEWIGSFCLSEAGSGSDALGAQTRATLSPDGQSYILNGTKAWITNAGYANLFTVFAKIDGEHFTGFLVERDYPGVSFGPEEHKLGMKGSSTRRVILDNVAVPVNNLLGEIGKGHYAAFCALNMGRFKLEAGAVGGLKETIAQCASYATQRKQFGHSLADFGLVQAKIGEMISETFVLESAIYRLAGQLDGAFEGIQPDAADAPARYHRAAEEFAIECNIVKVLGSELYSWATDEGIQIHGGYGYTEEFPMARAWRDQRLLRIGEGANEVVRMAIITSLLRRARQGRIELEPTVAAAKMLRSTDVPGGVPGMELVNRLKIASLVLLGAGLDHFGAALQEEQEILACIADIVIAAYATESAWLRARKLANANPAGEAGKWARDAVKIYLMKSRQLARVSAEECIGRLAELSGSTPTAASDTLYALLRTERLGDAIGMRRSLALAAIEKGGYLW